MKRFRMLLPYCFTFFILFYIVPFIIQHRTKNETIILFLIAPILCLIVSIVYGVLNGFKWSYPLMIAILYIPSVFLLAEQSGPIYIFVYAIQGVIGNFVGSLFQKC